MKMTQLSKNEQTVVLACLKAMRENIKDEPPPDKVPDLHQIMDSAQKKVEAGPLWVLELDSDEHHELTEILSGRGFPA